jgi:hypothetical protein
MKKYIFLTMFVFCCANTFCQNNSLNQLYGEWQSECIPFLSIGERACSITWEGRIISTSSTLIECDTLHFFFILEKKSDGYAFRCLELKIHPSDPNIHCNADIYWVDESCGHYEIKPDVQFECVLKALRDGSR